MLPPVNDSTPVNEPSSEELQFLQELDGVKKIAQAKDLISKNDAIYHKCLFLISNKENIVAEHNNAITNIFRVISEPDYDIQDSAELRILKICSDKGLMAKHLLHAAIEKKIYHIIPKLLESGVDPNACNDSDIPAFVYLCKHTSPKEQEEIAPYFLKNEKFDLDLNLKSALRQKNFDAMKILIENGASTDIVTNDFRFAQSGIFSRDNPDFFKADSKLLNIFKNSADLKETDEKTFMALYKVWMDPINSSYAISENERELAANFLIRQPSFGMAFPNLTTLLLKLIMENPSGAKLIAPCLNAMPWLATAQQGKELMREAVENNNVIVVKELLDRKINVTELYGSPLSALYGTYTSSSTFNNTSPWHHAIAQNKSEIAELMLQSGISPEVKNQQGQSAIGQLLELPTCWNSHKETLNVLIAHGADVESVNQSGKSLLSCIVDTPDNTTRPWPITFALLNRNAHLSPEEQWKLFEQAINDKQLCTASILSNQLLNTLKEENTQSLFKTMNADLLAKIVQLGNQSWAQAILTEWVAAGLNLNDYVTQNATAASTKGTSLLHFVIEKKKNYALAAFLISLGANLDLPDSNGLTPRQILEKQKIDPADLMTYVHALQKGSEALKALRQELSLRNMGHLLADDFLQKMTNVLGEKLEGNAFSYSLVFMDKILNYILERYEKNFTSEERNKIEIFKRQIHNAQSLAMQIDDVATMKSNNPFLTLALQNLAGTVKNQLDNLPENEILWLPYGWRGVKGHATMIGCQKMKDEWQFMVVNTGGGIQYHETTHDRLRVHADTIRVFEIPQQAIDDGVLLQQIFEPAVLGSSSNYNADDTYAIFQSFATGAFNEEMPSAWMKAQLSGTCSFRCLLAAGLATVGRDTFKKLGPLAKQEVTEIGFEQHMGLIKSEPALAKLFSEVIPRLSNRVTRNINRNSSFSMAVEFLGKQRRRLDKLDRMQQSLQASLPPQKSEISPIQYSQDIPTVTGNVRNSIAKAGTISTTSSAGTVNTVGSRPLPLITPKAIRNSEEFSNAVTDFDIYLQSLQTMDREAEVAVCQFLITLSKALIDGNGKPKPGLYDSIANNPRECLTAILRLERITAKLFDYRDKRYDDGTKRIAYCSALSVGWLLGQIIDKNNKYSPEGQLSNYALPLDLLSPLLANDRPPLLDAEAMSDLMRVYKFFYATKGKGQELFTFHHQFLYADRRDRQAQFLQELSHGCSEYTYAKAHVHALSQNDKEMAKQKYDNLREAYKGYKIHEEEDNEWYANYSYANNLLPAHFLSLRKLALMTRMDSPFAEAWEKKSTDIIINDLSMTPRYGSDELSITFRFAPAPHLNNPYSKSLDLSLPKKNDNASFKNKSSSLIENAYLEPIAQNDVVTQSDLRFHGLLSLRSPCLKRSNTNAVVAMTMLLDYFEMNLNELTKQDARIVFATTFTGNSKRLAIFKEKTGLADEFLVFYDHAIDHFTTQVQGNIQKEGSLQALLFMLEQKQRLLRQMKLQGLKTVTNHNTSLESVRREIREWRASPECRNPAEQQYLCMMLLDSYNTKEKLGPDQIRELIALRAEHTFILQSLSDPPLAFPHLRNSAERATLKHHAEIKAFLNENEEERNQLCSNILKINKIENRTGEWKESAFPNFVLMSSDGSSYQIDVLNGILLKNGQNLAALANIKESDLFKELFADQKLVGTQQSDYIESQDAQGKGVRFYTLNTYGGIALNSVQRQIDGEWYKYIPIKSQSRPMLPPLPDLANLQVYQKVGTAKPEYLIVDKATLSPKYHLDSEGYFSFPAGANAKRYEWSDIGNTENGAGVKGFDPEAILWKPAPLDEKDVYPLLIAPHYHDEQGNLIAFTYRDGKWEWNSSKQLHIAPQQVISGVFGLKRYLVLENDDGEKEVLFPKQSLTQLKKDESISSTCERIKLENDKPVSRSPTKNAYLAYLALAHAVTPADYAVAMDYLKQAFRFEAYSGGDLRLLGCIFNLSSEKHDLSGSMDSVRLYAAWLVHDNLKRNPPKAGPLIDKPSTGMKKDKPGFNSPEKDWKEYWKNEWHWPHKKDQKVAKNFNTQVSKLMSHYLARRKNVSHAVKLENILEPHELVNWGLERNTEASRAASSIADLPRPKAEILDLDRVRGFGEHQRNPVPEIPQAIYTRPGEKFYRSFGQLYQAAKSSDVKERNKVQQILNGMSYDKTRNNSGLRAIIQAALVANSGENFLPNYPAAVQIVACVDKIRQGHGRFEYRDEQTARSQLNVLLKGFMEASEFPIPSHGAHPKNISPKEIIPPHSPYVLPSKPPEQTTMDFKPAVGIAEFKTLYDEYFDLLEIPVQIGDQESFDFKTDDPFLQNSIHELNNDLATGTKNNQAIPQHGVKDQSALPLTVKNLQLDLTMLHKKETDSLKIMREEMLDLARQPSEDLKKQILKETATQAGHEVPLEESDCIALFLQGDPAEFRRLTNLTTEEQIQKLYQLIGDFLLLSHKVDHIGKVLGDVGKLDKLLQAKTPSEIEKAALVQKIGNGLAITEQVDYANDPAAFLVLEQGLNLYMKKDQVEGLREMLAKAEGDHTRFRSILLQRIQGGGKTLIFGPTLALLKADGYHLSIHVPATAQYSTALYDMHHQSGRIFGQKERTLEFDDDPERYTVEYLTWMLDTMDKAVVDKEYINMTKETLRAMRCKYIKMRLVINEKLRNSNGIETAEIADLELKNALLKEMLKIMRERGVFTFDEVHLATDPKKELNMPFGSCTSVQGSEAKMIGKTLQIAATVKNENGLLLKLCENQQSQQTEEKYAEMVVAIADRLIQDPWVQMYLKQLKEDMTQDDLVQVKEFFLGIQENIPDFIDKKVKTANEQLEKDPTSRDLRAQSNTINEAADLIVLAKQLLAGQWLKKRLDKSVDVHQGFSAVSTGPRVAIPFIANNVAAEGSEFSDRNVMMINTLMSYAVKGLSEGQTVDFINQLRKAAFLEREAQQDENPQFSLKDTTASKKFHALCNLDLFHVDIENPEAIESIRKKLLSGSEQSLETMFEYAIAQELPKVEIYDFQVCSHGQNTLSMSQSNIGYSASVENPNMKSPGMEIQPEPGTNGQTIDLFVRQNDEVWVINPSNPAHEMDSIFTDLIAKHPQKKQIRANIDVGGHFKGISNDDVAIMTCTFLQKDNSAMQGVLSFDPQSGKLMFRHKNQPHHSIALSGTRPEIIKKETGYDPNELFTYYDQDHITGIDITQFIDTKAVITWSEHTKIHEALQGGRRLRELNLAQRLISAVEQGAVNKVDAKLNRKPGELPIGKDTGRQLNIKDLILFAHLNEVESQREENLLYCLQKMEDVLQQAILDRSFDSTVDQERELFKFGEHLFSKSIATNLYLEYAFKREPIPMIDFLINSQLQMMQPLENILDTDEYQDLGMKIAVIINEASSTLKPSMDVSPLAQKSPALSNASLNSDASMVQFRQQEGQKISDTDKRQENQAIQEKLSELDLNVFKTHKTAAEISFDNDVLKSAAFGNEVQIYNGSNPCLGKVPQAADSDDVDSTDWMKKEIKPIEPPAAEVWRLDGVIAKEMGEEYKGLFDDHLLVSSNFAVSWANRVDLTGSFKKEPFQWMMIGDEKDGQKDWKLMLISVQDAIDFHNRMAAQSASLPPGRTVLLLRPSHDIKYLRDDTFDLKELEKDPQVKKLMAQAMLFTGRLQTLNRKKWNDRLDETLPKGDMRKQYCKFVEERIMSPASMEYQSSKVYNLLHS